MKTKINYKAVSIIWALLLCTLAYSFLTETILSVFRNGQTVFGIIGIIGFVIINGGAALLGYGGYLLVKNTVLLFFRNEKLLDNISVLRDTETSREDKEPVRKENFNYLVQAWKPSFIYFGLALIFILAGALALNISEGNIHISL